MFAAAIGVCGLPGDEGDEELGEGGGSCVLMELGFDSCLTPEVEAELVVIWGFFEVVGWVEVVGVVILCDELLGSDPKVYCSGWLTAL